MEGYPLAVGSWDSDEVVAIQKVIRSDRFTMGEEVAAFEREFAEGNGSRYAVMVNSGSSANLLAIASLFYRERSPLSRGDEVIVPAISWATTYAPLQQHGLHVKLVDVCPRTLNMDLDALEAAIGPRTRLVFAVNLLGSPNDFGRIRELLDGRDIVLVEDNCESMGAELDGKRAGTFGLLGTFSTFFSHHISTMEGGLVLTDDEELYHLLLSLRAHGWTRSLPKENRLVTKEEDPFLEEFRFVLPGYNLRPLEMSGAIGRVQWRKLPGFVEARRWNAAYFLERFGAHPHLAVQQETGRSSWFGFALVIRPESPWQRADLVTRMRAAGIECRPIVAGNFAESESIRYYDHELHGDLASARHVSRQGFFVGNHHVDIRPQIDLLEAVLGVEEPRAATPVRAARRQSPR